MVATKSFRGLRYLGHLYLECEVGSRKSGRRSGSSTKSSFISKKREAVDESGHAQTITLHDSELSFLAPLEEEGKIRVRYFLKITNNDRSKAKVRADVYSNKISKIKGVAKNSVSAEQVITHSMLDMYRHAKRLSMPSEVVKVFQSIKEPSSTSEPAQKLIHGMLSALVMDIRKQETTNRKKIKNGVSSLDILEPIQMEGISLYPVADSGCCHGRARTNPNFILLSDGIRNGFVEVTEISDSGSVPVLKVHNEGAYDLLVPEGMLVKGGKQNRNINVSSVIARKSKSEIQVSCVEKGRWVYRENGFKEFHFSIPEVRAASSLTGINDKSDGQKGQRSTQTEVWKRVSGYLDSRGISSRTSSLADAYSQKSERKKVKCPDYPEGAIGVIAMKGDRLIAADIFYSDEPCKSWWNELVMSYYISGKAEDQAQATKKEDVKEIINSLSRASVQNLGSAGKGTRYILSQENVCGSVLWYKDQICHLAAYPCEA